MEQNTQPSNNKTNPLIWVVIGVLIAAIIFTGGYILANRSDSSPTNEVVEFKNPTTVNEQSATTPTAIPTTTPTKAPETPDSEVATEPNVNVEIILDAEAIANATVRNAPASSDGIIYQADVYEYLTLRDAPSTSAWAISLLPPYTRMQIIEHSNATMAKVYLVDSHQEGYVNKEYISPEGSVMKRAGKAPSVSITDSTIYYANVSDFLTLREGASTSAKEITRLAPFTSMQIIERSGKMAYVYVLDSGLTGWVNTEYIISNINFSVGGGQANNATNNNPYDIRIGGYYYANVDEFLTLRESPSTSGREIRKLAPGTSLIIVDIANSEFCYVHVEMTDERGYVMSSYLSLS